MSIIRLRPAAHVMRGDPLPLLAAPRSFAVSHNLCLLVVCELCQQPIKGYMHFDWMCCLQGYWQATRFRRQPGLCWNGPAQ